jgi:hypothetical protein
MEIDFLKVSLPTLKIHFFFYFLYVLLQNFVNLIIIFLHHLFDIKQIRLLLKKYLWKYLVN